LKIFNLLFTLLFLAIAFFVGFAIYKNYNQPKPIKTEQKERTIKKDKKAQKRETKENTKINQEPKTKPKELDLKKRLKALNAKLGDRVFLRIFKKEETLEVWIKPKRAKKYKLLKSYKICKYSGTLGPKLKEGDYQAPEGFYKVYKGSLNPHSKFHLSFNLGYPNRYDRAHKRTGSFLMVHGECASIGCYAMGNKNIEEIYLLVKKALYAGQKGVWVHIFPFRLTRKNLAKYKNNKWYNFWQNLKEGYDIFEKTKIPPIIGVKNKRYKVRARF
jgi:murein L,D-transpeptidase YafK